MISLYVESLNRFKDFELQHQVFSRCDSGAYNRVMMQPATGKVLDSAAGSSSSVSHTELWTDHSDKEKGCVEKSFGADIFEKERYIDSGLVLSTIPTMKLASAFILDCINSSHDLLTLFARSNEKSKSGRRANPSHSGRLLSQHIRENRIYQLSLRILSRVCELDRRYTNSEAVKESNREQMDNHCDVLQKLLQNVLSSMYIDEKLGLGCMIGLPMNKAFDSFKVNCN